MKSFNEHIESDLLNEEQINKVCSPRCIVATGDKCVCKCGGLHHGELSKNNYDTLDPTLSPEQAKPFFDAIKDFNCHFCPKGNTSLEGEPIRAYPHYAGWKVQGYAEKQWLYIICPKCRYSWAIWKLGVSRE